MGRTLSRDLKQTIVVTHEYDHSVAAKLLPMVYT